MGYIHAFDNENRSFDIFSSFQWSMEISKIPTKRDCMRYHRMLSRVVSNMDRTAAVTDSLLFLRDSPKAWDMHTHKK